MKITNLEPDGNKAGAATRGRVDTRRAGGTVKYIGADGEVVNSGTLILTNLNVNETEDGDAIIGIPDSSLGTTVDDGTTTVDDVTGIVVPPGGFTDNGDGTITLNFLTNILGEQHTLSTVPDAGPTETLDLSAANWFDVTLTEACTIAVTNPPVSGVGGEWSLGLRGEFDVTWPATFAWRDTDGSETATPPTMSGEFNMVTFSTLNGGLSYGAVLDNGGSGGTSGLRWEAVTDGEDVFVWESDDLVHEWKAY
jgi:hypothetical protein